jgi:hypothetical protein
MDGVSTTHDSLKLNFMVVVNAIENYTETRPVIFPNPARERIEVLSTDPKFIVERVRIWSMDGLLIAAPPFKGELNVAQLVQGVYFVELISTTGAVTRYKIIKE